MWEELIKEHGAAILCMIFLSFLCVLQVISKYIDRTFKKK